MTLSVLIAPPLSAGKGNCEARKRTRGRCVLAGRRPRDERPAGLARPFLADDEANGLQEDPQV